MAMNERATADYVQASEIEVLAGGRAAIEALRGKIAATGRDDIPQVLSLASTLSAERIQALVDGAEPTIEEARELISMRRG